MKLNIEDKKVLFLEKLKVIKDTHPNIYNLWYKYVEDKINALDETLNKGFNMLESSESIEDLTKEQILTIYCIKSHNTYKNE